MHSPTLLLVLLALVAMTTCMLFAAWRLHPDIRGLREWFLGFLFALINIVDFSFKPDIPPLLDLFIVQFSLVMTGVMGCLGVYRFVGKKRFPFKTSVCAVVVVLASTSYYLMVVPSLPIRFMIGSTANGLFLIVGAMVMFQYSKRFPARMLFAGALLFHGAFMVIRSFLVNAPSKDLLFSDASFSFAQLILMEQVVVTVLFSLGVVMLINERVSHELKIRADRDSLTNLFNRGAFMRQLDKEVSRAVRSGAPLSLLIIDLDHFKSINDRYGHAAGDLALFAFAEIVGRTIRIEDTPGRLGGEEFAVALPNTQRKAAVQIAERLRLNVSNAVIEFEDQPIQLSISVGVSTLTASDRVESLLCRADQALYRAKASGRNRVESETASTSTVV